MIYPFNINTVEQLDLDPTKQINGYIWYNTVEKVYKSWNDGILQVFLTDLSFQDNITDYVESSLKNHTFKFTFDSTYAIIIRHNKNTHFFNYNVFDTELNSGIQASMSIIDENEVKLEFIDPVTGYLFMYFE